MDPCNNCQLTGNISQDPTYLTTGKSPALYFTMATNKYWTDHEGNKQSKATFHRCALHGKLAETFKDMLTKGKQLTLVGSVDTYTKKNEDGTFTERTTIGVEAIRLLGSMEKGTNGSVRTKDAPIGSEENLPF